MKNMLKCSRLISVTFLVIVAAFQVSQVNAGAKKVMARAILILTFLLISGNITAARLSAEILPDEPEEHILRVTYTDPAVLKGPLSFGLSSLPPEVNVRFQFASHLPVSGVINPDIISASLVFGNVELTAADLFVPDDDVSVLPKFTLGFHLIGNNTLRQINQVKYAFGPFTTAVVAEGIVLNSFFELNVTGTDIATGEDFHYRYTTSSQTVDQADNALPVASWPADGDANDATGNDNNGTLQGDTTYVDGRCEGQAFSFDGAGDYVEVPHSDGLSITEPITIDAWIRVDNWDTLNVIVSKGGSYIDNNYSFRVDSGELAFFYGNNGWHGWRDSRLLSLNTWYHVAAVQDDDGDISFYIDGQKGSGVVTWGDPAVTSKVTNDDPLRIGHINGHNQYFAGAIDNLEIYSRALSEAEIQELYNACSNNPPVAVCSDVTVDAGADCTASSASIDNGSHDSDGDPITIIQDPAGPYGVGDTEVTLTVSDEDGESDSCTATVTVVDNSCPTVTAKLVQLNGKKRKGCFRVDLSASDNCDLDPQIVATINFGTNGSAGVIDGQLVELRKKKKFKVKTDDGDSGGSSSDDSSSDDCGNVRFEGPSFTLTANAIDSAGNVACDVDEVIFTFDDGSSVDGRSSGHKKKKKKKKHHGSDDKSSDDSSSDDGTDTVPCPPNCPL